MRLKAIKIQNFRSYIHETTITIDNLNDIVGKNDAGESTIIGEYYNNKTEKIYGHNKNTF
jgi:predicted ATPase